jgi:uncharacterized metal-binding protein YceD (DUF177 family)
VSAPEFSRTVRADTLGDEPRTLAIDADEAERAALARRFDLVAIGRLSAQAALVRKGADVVADGRIEAAVTQSCVATGEPVEAEVDEPFSLVFRRAPDPGRPDEEVELSEGDLDLIFYDGASIDLGEAVAETMAIALDPYPRAPGAEEALKAAGVKSEEEAGPFGALAALRDNMKE